MSRLAILALLLSACAAPVPPAAPEPEPVAVVEPEAAPAPVVNHAPANAAVRQYRKAERAEAQAVTAPGATAGSIAGIHEADKAARRATAELVRQNGRPTPEAIAHARRTLEELTRALEATPQ